MLSNMEKKGLRDVGKYSELEKRFKLTTGLVTGTILQIFIWLGMAIALIAFSENGTCTKGFALEWDKICTECQVDLCEDCTIRGFQACDTCQIGFHYDFQTAKCEDCDQYADGVACELCESKDKCLKCSDRFTLSMEGS